MFNYPVQIQFDACNVPLIIEHQYTIQYETSFDNDYNGELLCKDDKITGYDEYSIEDEIPIMLLR